MKHHDVDGRVEEENYVGNGCYVGLIATIMTIFIRILTKENRNILILVAVSCFT